MRATQAVTEELKSIHEGFHFVADDMTDDEWTARVAPGMNLPGFTLWHLTRTLDAFVQTAIRGVPEVITQARWAACGTMTTPGFGFLAPLEEADAIARGMARADVSAYADAVQAEVLSWLARLSDEDLDPVPDWRTHIAAFPVYQVPELTEGPDAPVWGILLDPCGLHRRGHLSEVALIKQQRRLTVTMPSTEPSTAPPAAGPSAEAQVAPRRKRRWWWPWGRR
jgi:hypothetical protein